MSKLSDFVRRNPLDVGVCAIVMLGFVFSMAMWVFDFPEPLATVGGLLLAVAAGAIAYLTFREVRHGR